MVDHLKMYYSELASVQDKYNPSKIFEGHLKSQMCHSNWAPLRLVMNHLCIVIVKNIFDHAESPRLRSLVVQIRTKLCLNSPLGV